MRLASRRPNGGRAGASGASGGVRLPEGKAERGGSERAVRRVRLKAIGGPARSLLCRAVVSKHE